MALPPARLLSTFKATFSSVHYPTSARCHERFPKRVFYPNPETRAPPAIVFAGSAVGNACANLPVMRESPVSNRIKALDIGFGSPVSGAAPEHNTLAVSIAAPVLGDRSSWLIPLPPGECRQTARGIFYESGEIVFGFLRGKPGLPLEESAKELYQHMFDLAGSRHLQRVWHFLPAINAWETALENYQLFCRARADSFSRIMGENFQQSIPAASAVGFNESEPVMMFAAGKARPRYFENPEQVPAFEYPVKYGPKPPGFSRATRVSLSEGILTYISGTASIKGSETIHPGDLGKQVETTLHNLELIGQAAGLGADLGKAAGGSRRIVVYVRHPGDLPLAARMLGQSLPHREDEVIFLQADICRIDLLVEIEATVFIPFQPDSAPPG